MTIFLQATVEGLSLAAIYSLVAIGFVLIYKSMDVLSFAQPALAVVGAGIISSLAVDRGLPFIPCLLYTSPSPRDKRQSRMPSSA